MTLNLTTHQNQKVGEEAHAEKYRWIIKLTCTSWLNLINLCNRIHRSHRMIAQVICLGLLKANYRRKFVLRRMREIHHQT